MVIFNPFLVSFVIIVVYYRICRNLSIPYEVSLCVRTGTGIFSW